MMPMAHRFSLPTEAEMENLIVQVYESLPNPDKSRLSLIESKLLHKARKNKDQKNLNKMPWWIVLILAGGFASAAWWAGEQLPGRQDEETILNELQSGDKIINKYQDMNEQAKKLKQNDEQRVYENKDSPIIYQREVY
jgi:hypothetical protein